MLSRSQAGYLARESFAGFGRRKLTTGVTILIMGSSLLVLAVLTLATLNLSNLLETARSGIDLRVFLEDGIGREDAAELQPHLVAIPGVEQAVWISAEDALEEFRTTLGEDAAVLEMLDSNPLPASFHLTLTPEARNLTAVGAIRAEAARWPQVAEIIYNQDWIDVLERWTFRFQMVSLAVGLVVFLAAIFVISNTVKLTIASSARLIQIQKLVGATNAFIRTPFLCEGMIQGLLAGSLAMGLLAVGFWFLKENLEGLVPFTPAQMGGFVLLCMFLGLAGSWAAMRKYLTLQSETA
ncbi:ABC transporter permease [bacterium]|nr:ABC transporter permease [bacterium]